MNFDWYKIFNLTEFEATGLVSRTVTVFMEGIGTQEILITKGNLVSMMYADTLLPVEFLDKNPYSRAGDDHTYAVFKDEAADVWLGIGVEA